MEKILNYINTKNIENNKILFNALDNINNETEDKIKERFLIFLSKYVEWNSAFPGCVCYLTSLIHLEDFFKKDINDKYIHTSTHADIASYIFGAAEDEYGFEGNRHTHRKMALNFIDSFKNLIPNNELINIPSLNKKYIQRIKSGYGVGVTKPNIDIFKYIGFHLASEMLATTEFSLIDNIFNNRLSNIKQQLLDNDTAPYDWVSVHIAVEIEHFNLCLKGTELALDYVKNHYSDLYDDAVDNIIEGFNDFANIQEQFFKEA